MNTQTPTESAARTGKDAPTPRTDAEALWPACNDNSDSHDPSGLYVRADFARQLEREAAAKDRTIAALTEALEGLLFLRENQFVVPNKACGEENRVRTAQRYQQARAVLAQVKKEAQS